ncbi:MAG: hypothetical protein SVO01_01685 [Thermotogota bacterium]|nr:hypothetical protein [Thermotogota bacterium]
MDLNHAAKAAVSLKTPYEEFINKFLKLRPRMFHISDGKLKNEKDEHLNIGEEDYDFGFLLKCIDNNPFGLVTLKTPRLDLKLFNDDIQNVKN